MAESPCPLSPEQIGFFHRQGYLMPVDVLTPSQAAEAVTAYRTYRTVTDRAGGLLKRRWNYPKIHLVARWADGLVHHPGLLDLASSLIGPDLLVWSTNLFVREGHSGSRLAWHQDAPYFGWEGAEGNAVRVWLALTRTSRDNGTMLYCRRSHKAGLLRHDFADRTLAGLMRGEQADYDVHEDDVVAVEIEAGQASLHQPTTVHSSGPSTVAEERICFAVDYLAPSVRPVHGPDSALLVRGEDRYRHFLPERRPEADFAPDALRAFREAVLMRDQRLAAVMRVIHDERAAERVSGG
ncbi:phytanoyl-CoA dioxygenase family protein [Streptomyces sp. UNOB3_S3]|uniref:phytanoyl-CoA dioxygenase family protein n=1 Tax=Streptomyces sp. UNOB3_S3 TaxID=2871682 RepID=UPI001E3E77C0|nr:phytanoyl-CoA dioxygenase family protein [Streptomyces sp. UNOB3_S3]MCC3776568.1 phytanoyl-CoA dioxygenase family protein [Streptomyces sp. UNOB3_S3]